MRQAVRRWLRDSHIPADEAFKILTALGEAAANAIEHAYGPDDATFQVTGVIDPDRVSLTVRDRGSWRPSRGQNRGRGFLLMRSLMDTVEIERTAGGTAVHLSRHVPQNLPS
jgi:anti-sigma regulatory factor (Ser/Thr protein kinase)